MAGWIGAAGADVVLARGAAVLPRRTENDDFEFVVHGRGRNGRYDPAMTTAYASTWLFRRSAFNDVGPWRPALKCVAGSSQDWLCRAWRSGVVLATMPHLAVLMPQSGMRMGSYVGDQADEQIALSRAMKNPDALRLRVVENSTEPNPFSSLRYWKRRPYAACGIDPRAKSFRRKYSRGSLIQGLRLKRGLAPSPERDPDVHTLRKIYRKSVLQNSAAENL